MRAEEVLIDPVVTGSDLAAGYGMVWYGMIATQHWQHRSCQHQIRSKDGGLGYRYGVYIMYMTDVSYRGRHVRGLVVSSWEAPG
jgi:hypothetical protein